MITGGTRRDFRERTSKRIWTWLLVSANWLQKSTARLDSWRLPGCLRKGRTSFRYPEPSVGVIGRKCCSVNLKLSADDLERLEEVVPKGVAAGQRYSESMMNLVNG